MLDERAIVDIARNASTRRGHAVYDDFNDALRKEICEQRWLQPTRVGWYLFTIKGALLRSGWRFQKERPARFYPPARS